MVLAKINHTTKTINHHHHHYHHHHHHHQHNCHTIALSKGTKKKNASISKSKRVLLLKLIFSENPNHVLLGPEKTSTPA